VTSDAVSAAAVWRRRDDVLWRRSLDAVILLPVGADDPLTLPGTGAIVWDLLEEPATLAELVATLAEAFEEDPAVVEHDVSTLLAELEDLAAVSHD
jgi:Coenzyme PQQ synthesis protein D (PqqD)